MSADISLFSDKTSAKNFHFTGFDSLIAPVAGTAFFDGFWEQRPFYVARDKEGYFDPLLSLAIVDEIIGTRVLRQPDIRLAKNGKVYPFDTFSRDGCADRNAVVKEFKDGATIILEHLNRHHRPLGEILHQCEVEMHVPFRSNVYMTPPGSQGFVPHWDTHDVLILQVAGSKTWNVFDSPLVLPDEEQKYSEEWGSKARQIAELTLRPGDTLFLPRGYIHSAKANEECSLHITVGMRSFTIRDVVMRALSKATLDSAALRRVALFREYYHTGKLEDTRALLHELVDSLDLKGALGTIYTSFIKNRTAPAHGRLLASIRKPELSHSTRFQVRKSCLYQVFKKNDTVRLALDGKVVIFPVGVDGIIDYIGTQPSFTPAELPGMEHESQLILASRLYDEGLIEPVAA